MRSRSRRRGAGRAQAPGASDSADSSTPAADVLAARDRAADPAGRAAYPVGRAADPPAGWPLTLTARWTDHGYGRREWTWELAIAAALAWMGVVGLVAPDAGTALLVAPAAALAAWLGWRRLRARPVAMELVLEPTRLRVRHGSAAAWLELRRSRAGQLVAAETGLDWRERKVGMSEDGGRIVTQMRAGLAAVEIADAGGAAGPWWDAVMPPGTTPDRPPAIAAVTALLGAWWPDEERRTSIRGGIGGRLPWREPDLRNEAIWDRRRQRLGASLLIAAVVVSGAFALGGTWPPAPAELLAFGPPGLAGLGVGVRGLFA